MLLNLSGYPGARLRANAETWLGQVLQNNPGLFDAFDDPTNPNISKCMWHGEFPGKLLTGMAQAYLCLGTGQLLETGNQMAQRLKECQKSDGYLGPWEETRRFDGDQLKWDTWGHYHCILGLYRWYQATGNTDALETAKKALDCVYNHFILEGRTFVSQNWAECNLAIGHAFALLYQETGEKRYLETAEYIVETEWKLPYDDFFTKSILCCDWMGAALEGKAFYQSNQPRWESLHPIAALGTLYEITGKQQYYDALIRIWDGIAANDLHNFGGFGTDECAQGKPYIRGSETCNTIAWMALSADVLRLSRRADVADELERAYYNAAFGSMVGDYWFAYMNNMSGKQVSAGDVLRDHGFAGGEEMSCCQANGSRGISMVSEWAVLPEKDGFFLNYYGNCAPETRTPFGAKIRFLQETVYPRDGFVRITLSLEREERFDLRLRIPGWSAQNHVSVNGVFCGNPAAGGYFSLDRIWKDGDVIELSLDVKIRCIAGAQECAGKTSVFYGPILLAFSAADVENPLPADVFETLRFSDRPDECLTGTAGEGEEMIPFFAYADAGRKDITFETWISFRDEIRFKNRKEHHS